MFRSSCVIAVLWFKENFMQICIFARQVKEGPAAGEFEERNTKLGKRSAGNWVFFVLPWEEEGVISCHFLQPHVLPLWKVADGCRQSRLRSLMFRALEDEYVMALANWVWSLCIYNFCFAYEYVYPLAFDSIWVYLNSSFLFRVVEQEWHVVKLWNCMKQLLSSQFQDCCDHAHTHMNVQQIDIRILYSNIHIT